MQRREFIRTSCLLCAGLLASQPLLQSCSTVPVLKLQAKNAQIIVDKATLKPNQKLHIVRNTKMDFDLLLVENENGTYHALYMQCTHYSQPLAANSKQLFCSAHGSVFNFNGEVLKSPAEKNLTKYNVESNANQLIIKL